MSSRSRYRAEAERSGGAYAHPADASPRADASTRPATDDREPPESAELRRLKRRIERERAARRQGEEIAERATRELYDRQRELVLLEALAMAANEATTVEEAMQVAVDRVCAHIEWPVGHVYQRDPGSGRLVTAKVWHLDDAERFEAFREVSEASSFAPGVGLAGRVLGSRSAVWVTDVSQDRNLPRFSSGRELGLRAGFGVPVQHGDEVVAVLEFFSPEPRERDDALLRLTVQVGAHLGRVIERKRAEEELRRLHRQTDLLLNSAGEGIFGLDLDGTATFVNPAAARMLGWSADALVGTRVYDTIHDWPGEEEPPPSSPLYEALRDGKVRRTDDQVFKRRDGTTFPVALISTPIMEDGDVAGAVVTFNDISERKRFQSQLQFLADHDPLTGLLNRRRFEEELTRELAHASRYGSTGALLSLDLDNFKYVNDTFGHTAGDDLLRHVAELLRARLRQTETVARFGGDEFAVLLRQVDTDQAQAVAADLGRLVREQAVVPASPPTRVTTSIGVTLLGSGSATGGELLAEADMAMYEAKDAGRDRVTLFAPGKDRRIRTGAGLSSVEGIRRALEEDMLALQAQPIVHLAGSELAQYELLVRIRGDDGRLVPPGAFLPVAERFGLIGTIDRWVIGQAVGHLATADARGRAVRLGVNLSGKSVGDPDLAGFVEHELAGTAVDPSRLVFEITEAATVTHIAEARELLNRLSELGCRFALDDFGSGFSSFYYLKHLPLDYLKIDGDFVRDLRTDFTDQHMVKAMVEMARGLDVRTIAEFVEDAETLALLERFGLDFVQGYHLGRPTSAGVLTREPPRR